MGEGRGQMWAWQQGTSPGGRGAPTWLLRRANAAGLCPNTRGTFQPLGWALSLTKQDSCHPNSRKGRTHAHSFCPSSDGGSSPTAGGSCASQQGQGHSGPAAGGPPACWLRQPPPFSEPRKGDPRVQDVAAFAHASWPWREHPAFFTATEPVSSSAERAGAPWRFLWQQPAPPHPRPEDSMGGRGGGGMLPANLGQELGPTCLFLPTSPSLGSMGKEAEGLFVALPGFCCSALFRPGSATSSALRQ